VDIGLGALTALPPARSLHGESTASQPLITRQVAVYHCSALLDDERKALLGEHGDHVPHEEVRVTFGDANDGIFAIRDITQLGGQFLTLH